MCHYCIWLAVTRLDNVSFQGVLGWVLVLEMMAFGALVSWFWVSCKDVPAVALKSISTSCTVSGGKHTFKWSQSVLCSTMFSCFWVNIWREQIESSVTKILAEQCCKGGHCKTYSTINIAYWSASLWEQYFTTNHLSYDTTYSGNCLGKQYQRADKNSLRLTISYLSGRVHQVLFQEGLSQDGVMRFRLVFWMQSFSSLHPPGSCFQT